MGKARQAKVLICRRPKSDTTSYADMFVVSEHPEPAFAVDILPFLDTLIDRNEG